MNDILTGGIAVASLLAGLFFLRFWRATGDRFFLFFAIAFWIEGAQRMVIQEWIGPDEALPVAYLPRLVAYALIIAAVIDKNRSRRRGD